MIKQLINNNKKMSIVIELQDEDDYTFKNYIPIEMWALLDNGKIVPMVWSSDKKELIDAYEIPNFIGLANV